jgi:hypothetical protein
MIEELKDFLILAVAGLVFGYCSRVLFDGIYMVITEVLK